MPGDPWARIEEAELVYDWGGQDPGADALPGDQVELLGAAGHTVVIGAGRVDLGAGQDTVVVDRARAGSQLAMDGGWGQDTLDLERLGPVQLQGGSFTAQTSLGVNGGVTTLVDSAGTDKLGFAVTGGTGGAGTGRIDYNQLWFERQANDLDIRVMGSTDEVRLRDWYLGSAGQLETIEAASSEGVSVQLLGADVQRLVDAMAGMSPPTGAASWNALSTTQNQQLLALGVWH